MEEKHKEKDESPERETELLEGPEDPQLLSEEHDGELINNLTTEIKSLQDKLLRAMAESENIRQRMNKMIEEARDYSIVNFAKDLVPVVDNLSRALTHLPENLDNDTKMLAEGVKMTKDELASVFKKHGIEVVEPQVGENFNYNQHYAISQLVTDQHKEGAIINVMQVGYKIKDRLIRPASVVVAKG